MYGCSEGMAACFVLPHALNPVYAICGGANAGSGIKHLWPLPFMDAPTPPTVKNRRSMN